jgi:ADP-heptose:LPS heptosyltransferase
MRFDTRAPLRVAKRLQSRFYAADYAEAALTRRWVRDDAKGPYEDVVYPVGPSPEDISTVLVYKPDEIGDAVYALPAVAELRRAFPRARVALICQPLTKPLYERSGLFDEIVAIQPSTRLGRPHLDLDQALAGLSASSFDMAVYLRTYVASFRQFTDVPARIKLHPIDPRMRSDSVHRAHVSLWDQPRRHQALQLLEIVSRVTGRTYGFDDVSFPEFQWTADDRRAVELVFGESEPGPFVVVHPFAKHETRQYPLDDWRELIGRVRERSAARWVVVGGPGDPVIDGLPDVLQTQGTLSLAQTGYLTSRASAFVGVLSGPVHWAAALGTPTLTIMSGHSLPVEWAPLGRSRILRADVPCAPCHQPTCPVYRLACLTELSPSRIEGQVTEFLADALASSRATSTRSTAGLAVNPEEGERDAR